MAQLPLDESQIARAAEEMIADFGGKALAIADARVQALRSEGFESVANTWVMIREVIKDLQSTGERKQEYTYALEKGVFLSE